MQSAFHQFYGIAYSEVPSSDPFHASSPGAQLCLNPAHWRLAWPAYQLPSARFVAFIKIAQSIMWMAPSGRTSSRPGISIARLGNPVVASYRGRFGPSVRQGDVNREA